ncbi:DUF4423 domain-containing protein [Pseudobacteriovorax antillogorgiicola]|uniref:DUF4423 domain-containing protein n=1 Tax=Pseudobacteriovorax antillogorgiicola TaxID=1513793 RepID=UPI0022858FF7|nr:DUF4423 domain-containing protein [Pseudobacteriovorax antillogorgiicola]
MSDKKTLSQSAFAVISNWYYYAILEMTFKTDFSSHTSDIAKKLGISVLEAELAIERLQNLGLLTKDAQGKWQKSKGNISDLEIASRPGTDRHVQILNKASKAIREQDFNMREFHSVTFCIDKSFLPDAKEKIRHFLEDMNLLLESGAREEVYELSVALFSLEKN